MNCKNCDNSVTENFCAHCGQNTKVDRLDLPNFLNELTDSIFQVNRGLLYTIRALFIRPGHTIREFLEGARKRHYKPVAFVLILSTVYFLVSRITDDSTFLNDFLSGVSQAKEESGKAEDTSPILNWISTNFAYSTLLLLPIFSLASYLSFSRFKQNYLEHIVINSFITGQQAIFYTFMIILNVLINNKVLTTYAALLTSVPYAFWTFLQFYSNSNRIEIIFRLLLAYILYFIFIAVLLFPLAVAT